MDRVEGVMPIRQHGAVAQRQERLLETQEGGISKFPGTTRRGGRFETESQEHHSPLVSML